MYLFSVLIAFSYMKMEDHVKEIKTLNKYIEALKAKQRPGHALVSAQFRVATAYKQLGKKYIPSALKRYVELVKMLSDPNNPYQRTAEEAEKNKAILEGSLYYKAMCYSMLTKPPKNVKKYRRFAIKTLEELVEKFPKSRFAPPALSQVGTLWTILEDPDKAQKALRRLKSEYSGTPEAENADFMLADNLLKVGMRQQAIRLFKQMFEGGGQYSDVQILTAGNELLKAREFEIALEAYDRVLKTSKKRAVLEPALMGKGKCLVAGERYGEAAEVLEKMLADYPRSGRTVEATMLLSTAYSEVGMAEPDGDKRFDVFNNAVKAIKTARQFATDAGIKARLDLEVARIMVRKARAEEQFGSKDKGLDVLNEGIATYQILIRLGDSNDPGVRPHIEDGYNECLPLLVETKRFENTIEDSREYLKTFPRGKWVVQARKWENQAKMALVTSGGAAPEERPEDKEETTEEPAPQPATQDVARAGNGGQ